MSIRTVYTSVLNGYFERATEERRAVNPQFSRWPVGGSIPVYSTWLRPVFDAKELTVRLSSVAAERLKWSVFFIAITCKYFESDDVVSW